MVLSGAGIKRQINETRQKIAKLPNNVINLGYDKGDILYQMGEDDGCSNDAGGTWRGKSH
jgi:hypothetical protein